MVDFTRLIIFCASLSIQKLLEGTSNGCTDLRCISGFSSLFERNLSPGQIETLYLLRR